MVIAPAVFPRIKEAPEKKGGVPCGPQPSGPSVVEGFYLQLEEVGLFLISFQRRVEGTEEQPSREGSHIDPCGVFSSEPTSLYTHLGVESSEAELVRTKDDS